MKSKNTAALLAFFLGGLGVHKFYLGENGRGILYLIFCWTWIPSLIGLIEAIKMFTMSESEFQQKYLQEPYTYQEGKDNWHAEGTFMTNSESKQDIFVTRNQQPINNSISKAKKWLHLPKHHNHNTITDD